MPFRCLDLFCGAGGSAMGLSQAGFEVVGVDVVPQPRYPFEFRLSNALEADLSGFDFVWASPPCQAHSSLRHCVGKQYEDFISRTRRKLEEWGGPWIIENVVGAPLLNSVRLCGSAFGLGVRRHRIFESNIPLVGVECRHDLQPEPIDVSGMGGRRVNPRVGQGGDSRKPRNLKEASQAMGINWMSQKEISQSIPPAYSRFLGRQVTQWIRKEPWQDDDAERATLWS